MFSYTGCAKVGPGRVTSDAPQTLSPQIRGGTDVKLSDTLRAAATRLPGLKRGATALSSSSSTASVLDGHAGRGRVLQVNVKDLEMTRGGVLRNDKKLVTDAFLTELLTETERKSVTLPNSRERNVWDILIAILVTYTAVMLPIQLCYDDVPLSLPSNISARMPASMP